MHDDIRDLLFAWGEWARSGNEQLGFKNNWDTIFSLAPEPEARERTTKKETVFICDQNAARIDHIVTVMSRSMLPCAIAIKARYVDLVSIENIGRGALAAYVYGKDSKTSVGKHKVRELLAKGEGYIEGALNNTLQVDRNYDTIQIV